MNRDRWFRLPGTVLVVAAVAASCSAGSSVTPPAVPDPSSAPSSPSPAATTGASETPSAPPALTETFTSAINGISVSRPAGWVTRAATEPWTTSEPGFDDPAGDVIYDPTLDFGHLFLAVNSYPLGATTADRWTADQTRGWECPSTEPVTVDGITGAICGEGNIAFVSTGGRGYVILLYTSGDEGWLDSVYDRAWFKDVLATVDLRPEDAVDVAPSPSP